MDEGGICFFWSEAARFGSGATPPLRWSRTPIFLGVFKRHLPGEFDQGIQRVHEWIIVQMF